MWRPANRLLRVSGLRASTCLLRAPIGLRSFSTKLATTDNGNMFSKILVANRGEIACRVMRTCANMGIETVAIFSDADADARHTQMADQAVCVGPARSADSYMSINNIVQACLATGAQAVHPGNGFLAENAQFSAELSKHGIAFIGPKTHSISAMTDKLAAKKIAKEAKLNTVPGSSEPVRDAKHAVQVASDLGFPVILKSCVGGGGKGLAVAHDAKECEDAFKKCSAESQTLFGDARVFVERFIKGARHIEIQVLCDGHGNAVFLNERECSVQRRFQKVIEEAPSPSLSSETRAIMGEHALALAKAVKLQSAATVEFLLDRSGNIYFLEMNQRLPTNHAVTELTTGLDLVEQQIRVAAGQPLTFDQKDVQLQGCAVEARVYAENPFAKFAPSTGLVRHYDEPFGDAVRCDSGVREGAEITGHYDPLMCKLVTRGETREDALESLRQALDGFVIRGVAHNLPFLRAVCEHPRFIDGDAVHDLNATFVAEAFPAGFKKQSLYGSEVQQVVSAILSQYVGRLVSGSRQLSDGNQLASFNADTFVEEAVTDLVVVLETGESPVEFAVSIDHLSHDSEPTWENPGWPNDSENAGDSNEAMEDLSVDGMMDSMAPEQKLNSSFSEEPTMAFSGTLRRLATNGIPYQDSEEPEEDVVEFEVVSSFSRDKLGFVVVVNTSAYPAQQSLVQVPSLSNNHPVDFAAVFKGASYPAKVYSAHQYALAQAFPLGGSDDSSKMVVCPMPGKVVRVTVAVGDTVAEGQEVCVVEAMKMQNVLRASGGGVVKEVCVIPGVSIGAGDVIIRLQ